jgi:hypothetical protein
VCISVGFSQRADDVGQFLAMRINDSLFLGIIQCHAGTKIIPSQCRNLEVFIDLNPIISESNLSRDATCCAPGEAAR